MCSSCGQEGHLRSNNKKCPHYKKKNASTAAQSDKATVCSSCGQEGHLRSNNKKCPHYKKKKNASTAQSKSTESNTKSVTAQSDKATVCSSCGQEGHLRSNNSKCPHYKKKNASTAQSKSTGSNNKPTPPAWRTSEAKKALFLLLENDHDGDLHAKDPKDVQKLSHLFQAYEYANFKTNLKNLKASIAKDKGATKKDEEIFLHDRSVIQSKENCDRGYPRWSISQAKRSLRKDIQDKKHENIKPKQLWKTRPEYQKFPHDVFRKHIYQEEISQVGRSYWMHKKKMKK